MADLRSRTRPLAVVTVATGAVLLAGCGVIRAPSTRESRPATPDLASCAPALARAHAALAAPPDSAPASHAAHAAAMHEYHICLAGH